MRMDKLTNKFQEALSDAQSLAVGRDNNYLEPVHVLQAMLDQQGGTIRQVLQKANVNIAQLRTLLANALDKLPQIPTCTPALAWLVKPNTPNNAMINTSPANYFY